MNKNTYFSARLRYLGMTFYSGGPTSAFVPFSHSLHFRAKFCEITAPPAALPMRYTVTGIFPNARRALFAAKTNSQELSSVSQRRKTASFSDRYVTSN